MLSADLEERMVRVAYSLEYETAKQKRKGKAVP